MIEKHESIVSFQLKCDGKGICIGAGRKNKNSVCDKNNLMISLSSGTVYNGGQESKYPEAKSLNKNDKILTIKIDKEKGEMDFIADGQSKKKFQASFLKEEDCVVKTCSFS